MPNIYAPWPQGAAIARAVMERALDAGMLIVASTHSNALKAYGMQEARLAVAAMALQLDGTPTFKMQLGAVGEVTRRTRSVRYSRKGHFQATC